MEAALPAGAVAWEEPSLRAVGAGAQARAALTHLAEEECIAYHNFLLIVHKIIIIISGMIIVLNNSHYYYLY